MVTAFLHNYVPSTLGSKKKLATVAVNTPIAPMP
jgi:hypothetical protein